MTGEALMRIAAVLECEEAIGGGFVQAVNSIVQMAEVCLGRHDFCVFSASEANPAPPGGACSPTAGVRRDR